jgi:iron complex transport system permease protein
MNYFQTMQIDVAAWRKEANKRQVSQLWIMTGVLVFALLMGITQGALKIDLFGEISELEKAIISDIRLPRVLMTLFTGAGLAICGLILQSICRNPLADPGIIGVSSGAALFAAIAILISSVVTLPEIISVLFVPAMAFAGAGSALFLLLSIAGFKQSINTLVLILTGVALNSGAATLLGLVTYLADEETLRVIVFWQLGSYSGISWQQAMLACIIVTCAVIYFFRCAGQIMLLQIGEHQAHFQGVNVGKFKKILLLLVATVTAICVCFTGILSFVGLVVPHISRMLVGNNLRVLIPASVLLGGALITFADVLARLTIVPAELPVGLLTSSLGVPFFLWLILREKRKFAYD